eukprot:1096849_1
MKDTVNSEINANIAMRLRALSTRLRGGPEMFATNTRSLACASSAPAVATVTTSWSHRAVAGSRGCLGRMRQVVKGVECSGSAGRSSRERVRLATDADTLTAPGHLSRC